MMQAGCRTEVGRTKVGRTSDESRMKVRRRTCRAQLPLRRWRATALHCSSSQRCSNGRERCSSQRCCGVGRQRTATCSVLPMLLQQHAGCHNVAAMVSNVLDLAACCCDVRQRAGPRSVVAMSNNATTPANVALQHFCFFFLPNNLKREKESEKERSFDTCSLMSRLHLSLLWLVVRNVKLLVGYKKRKAPSNNTSNALLPAAITRVATTQEFQKHKKSVAFNVKQQGIKFF